MVKCRFCGKKILGEYNRMYCNEVCKVNFHRAMRELRTNTEGPEKFIEENLNVPVIQTEKPKPNITTFHRIVTPSQIIVFRTESKDLGFLKLKSGDVIKITIEVIERT